MTTVAESPIRVEVRTVDIVARAVTATSERSLEPGKSLLIGREGDLGVGIDPVDTGISRHALEVAAAAEGWSITSHNGNGAMLHPWAQPSSVLETEQATRRRWPRLAVRLIGSRSELHHWVLLEGDRYTIDPARAAHESTNTDLSRPPQPLTNAQSEALRTVFSQHLAWPPVAGPVPMTLQSAARRLKVSDAAIYQRLEAAQSRAYQLGAYRQHGVTDPEYVYVLARHGYLGGPAQNAAAV
jgi:hypothetical protein